MYDWRNGFLYIFSLLEGRVRRRKSHPPSHPHVTLFRSDKRVRPVAITLFLPSVYTHKCSAYVLEKNKQIFLYCAMGCRTHFGLSRNADKSCLWAAHQLDRALNVRIVFHESRMKNHFLYFSFCLQCFWSFCVWSWFFAVGLRKAIHILCVCVARKTVRLIMPSNC